MSSLEASAKLFSAFVSNHPRLPFLAKIDLSHTTINSFQVAFLLRKCGNLIEISLQNCKNVTDHVFQHIHMEATISGEVPELAHTIEKVGLSYTSCTSLVIFCLIDEDVFPNLVSIGLEAIKMSKKDVTEIPLHRPTVMELPSPCPYLYGMPDMSEDDFSDVADFGPDLTDHIHMVMVSLIGVDQ